ncbi:hypothetical protein [uncultured Paracoccus sp.]|uniref:hypothetical protein n=1 Tax=uncultured Paracoccus sp. TaxID=189685 RepID=UPI002627AD46|nr:hypothetical protein [uncultured Paracoccus sp.]
MVDALSRPRAGIWSLSRRAFGHAQLVGALPEGLVRLRDLPRALEHSLAGVIHTDKIVRYLTEIAVKVA